MKFNLKILILCAFLYSFEVIASQVIPIAKVLAEETAEENKICQFSYESAGSAAEAALRFNRIEINRSSLPGGLTVYVGAGSFTELQGRNACAVVLQVEFYQFQTVNLPISSREIFSKVVHCRQGTAGTIPKRLVQDELNTAVKNMIEHCISDIEKKAR